MIEEYELYNIVGGKFNLSSTLLNAFARGVNTIMDVGRTLGTSIRMLVSGKRC